MTPLLQEIVRDTLKPVKKRAFSDRASIAKRLDDIHSFEVTAVGDAAFLLAKDIAKTNARGLDMLAFLPAPNTWIEWVLGKSRIGFQLIERNGWAEVFGVTGGAKISSHAVGAIALQSALNEAGADGDIIQVVEGNKTAWPVDRKTTTAMLTMLWAFLAMINTPKTIGRTTHMPHAGLQRELARAKGMTGKFPLNAWTEIKLEVGAPKEITSESQEIRLSGEKALHFVRAHLRIRRGQLEIVSAHWRGNAANGIKQSRYAVVPPKDGIAA